MLLTIKDNCLTPKSEFASIPHLVNVVADKTLEQLEDEGIFIFPDALERSNDITGDQSVIDSKNNCYQTSNIMGFLGYGNDRLVISSRFTMDTIGGSDFFLQYLINKILNLPNILNLPTDSSPDTTNLNLLLVLFPYYLNAALRKGLFKTYLSRNLNDSNPRGLIDISRHISHNTPFIGNIAYKASELSYDNDVTELIRHTIEVIKQKPLGPRVLFTVKETVQDIVSVTPTYNLTQRRRIIENNMKNPLRHAYYNEYRVLQKLCLLILRNQGKSIGTGFNKLHGLLFDGAWLWEEYINLLINDKFYHPRNKSGKGGQYLFQGSKGKIYPDFIGRNPNERIIADAKYKPNTNIYGRDYLQILAYMYRFESTHGLFIYPEVNEHTTTELSLDQGVLHFESTPPSRRECALVTKHGISIPREYKDYTDFAQQMEASEMVFKKLLTLEFSPGLS